MVLLRRERRGCDMVAVVLSNRKRRLLPITRPLHRGQRLGDHHLQGVFKG